VEQFIEVACQCGRTTKAPIQYAGRRGRCRGCGAVVQIPERPAPKPEPLDDELWGEIKVEVDDDDRNAYDVMVGAPISEVPLSAKDGGVAAVLNGQKGLSFSPASLPVPKEPWYYRFIDVYAKVILYVSGGGCILAFAAGLVFMLISIVRWSRGDSGIPVLSAMFVMAWAVGALVAVLSVVSPILLAVDAARNLRAIRYGSRQA
jgi:hypothetical protein